MLDLTLWQDRLNSAQTDIKKVGLAADLEAARRDLKQAPAAFIVLGSERAVANDELDEVDQIIAADVSIILAIENAGAKTGARNIDQLKTVRDQVDALILGWTPETGADPVEFVSGNLLGFKNQLLWWGDIYRTHFLKSN